MISIRRSILSVALAALAGSTLPSSAAPADWVGKSLPQLNLKYDDAAPNLKGKPAIVEFWATWCPPCRKSIPHLNEIFKKHKDKLVIVGVTDEEKKTVEVFRKGVPIDYTVGYDEDNKLGLKIGVEFIPQALLVDRTGKVVWAGFPTELTDETLEKVLK
jgi:thiol-disulfide isomerase/thioredoxin